MISEGFVQNGATVYVSSRDAKACEQACKEMNASGQGKADFIPADLYKEQEIQKIADELKKREGSAFAIAPQYCMRERRQLTDCCRARCHREQQR